MLGSSRLDPVYLIFPCRALLKAINSSFMHSCKLKRKKRIFCLIRKTYYLGSIKTPPVHAEIEQAEMDAEGTFLPNSISELPSDKTLPKDKKEQLHRIKIGPKTSSVVPCTRHSCEAFIQHLPHHIHQK